MWANVNKVKVTMTIVLEWVELGTDCDFITIDFS